MDTISGLLALCAGNSLVTGEFPSQRPVTQSFDVFFDLRVNKQLSKQSRCQWFETPSWSLWCHCNGWHIIIKTNQVCFVSIKCQLSNFVDQSAGCLTVCLISQKRKHLRQRLDVSEAISVSSKNSYYDILWIQSLESCLKTFFDHSAIWQVSWHYCCFKIMWERMRKGLVRHWSSARLFWWNWLQLIIV